MTIFIKIQDSAYVKDMFNEEYLYFSPLYGFRGEEEDTGRNDPKEGNLKNVQIKYLAIGEGEKKIELSESSSNFSAQYSEQLSDPKINCCSLYSLNLDIDEVPPVLDKRILSMGNSALIIYDELKFYEILDQSIEREGYEYSRKFVTYYNPKKYDGDLTLHHKDENFGYQKEYRILIAPTSNKSVKISIPGLKEISTIINPGSIDKLRITYGS